jgi:two-component system, OmpR family, sensor histidine kinase QseC
MKTSLSRRLLLSLGAVVLAAWVATAVFSYLDARDRIGSMLDDHLVQAAHLLLAQGAGSDSPSRPAAHWGKQEEGHSLVYQGWSDEGRLLFRSADAPASPLSDRAEGFALVQRDGALWRVFGARAPEGGVRVQVAEHAAFRDQLAASIARHLLHPVAFALPLLAALIWLSVRWSLSPLRALAGEVEQRKPANLIPLDPGGAPTEAKPLVGALNALFRRVAASVESERRFTADAAHELRTPLAAIQTHAEVALASRDDAERKQALAHVTDGTERASRLVAQLLMLARLDARATPPALLPVNLSELAARHIADSAPLAARKRVNLGLAEDSEPAATAAGDAELLGVMVRNLVDNAVRYTPDGGRVDVSVRCDAGRVLLSVTDSGPGIPAEERARVLERFYRGRGGSEDGSGLGLSIVARVAELHGAELSLDDAPGGAGLAVRVALTLLPKSLARSDHDRHV